MQHYGAVAVLEWIVQEHSAVQEGIEAEKMAFGSGEERAVTSRAFSAYGYPLDVFLSLKYLGRVLSEAYDDCPEVVKNLVKA